MPLLDGIAHHKAQQNKFKRKNKAEHFAKQNAHRIIV
jgi:hypothetical protein